MPSFGERRVPSSALGWKYEFHERGNPQRVQSQFSVQQREVWGDEVGGWGLAAGQSRGRGPHAFTEGGLMYST